MNSFNFKAVRTALGLTSTDAAILFGVSRRSVWNYDHGRKVPGHIHTRMIVMRNDDAARDRAFAEIATIKRVKKAAASPASHNARASQFAFWDAVQAEPADE